MKSLRQSVINSTMRKVGYVPASELPEAEYGHRSVRFGEVSGDGVRISLDYGKFSSHPKASGK
jgi:hypothetical protein